VANLRTEGRNPYDRGLHLLASWAATLDQLDQAATAQAPEEA
jgi:hypothetical protein